MRLVYISGNSFLKKLHNPVYSFRSFASVPFGPNQVLIIELKYDPFFTYFIYALYILSMHVLAAIDRGVLSFPARSLYWERERGTAFSLF